MTSFFLFFIPPSFSMLAYPDNGIIIKKGSTVMFISSFIGEEGIMCVKKQARKKMLGFCLFFPPLVERRD